MMEVKKMKADGARQDFSRSEVARAQSNLSPQKLIILAHFSPHQHTSRQKRAQLAMEGLDVMEPSNTQRMQAKGAASAPPADAHAQTQIQALLKSSAQGSVVDA